MLFHLWDIITFDKRYLTSRVLQHEVAGLFRFMINGLNDI